jgi:hypothetical protein
MTYKMPTLKDIERGKTLRQANKAKLKGNSTTPDLDLDDDDIDPRVIRFARKWSN